MSSDIRCPNRRKPWLVMRKCRIKSGTHDGWTDAAFVSFKTRAEATVEAIRLTKLRYAAHCVFNGLIAVEKFMPSGKEVLRQLVDPRNELHKGESTIHGNIERA